METNELCPIGSRVKFKAFGKTIQGTITKKLWGSHWTIETPDGETFWFYPERFLFGLMIAWNDDQSFKDLAKITIERMESNV